MKKIIIFIFIVVVAILYLKFIVFRKPDFIRINEDMATLCAKDMAVDPNLICD